MEASECSLSVLSVFSTDKIFSYDYIFEVSEANQISVEQSVAWEVMQQCNDPSLLMLARRTPGSY